MQAVQGNPISPMPVHLGCSLHLQDHHSKISPITTLAHFLLRGRRCYWLLRDIVLLMCSSTPGNLVQQAPFALSSVAAW